MMGGIGFTVGLIGFLLYTLIGIFGAIKYNTVRYPPRQCIVIEHVQ